jgi:hypothetical protein
MPDKNSDTIIAAVMEQLVAECGRRAQRCRLRRVSDADIAATLNRMPVIPQAR